MCVYIMCRTDKKSYAWKLSKTIAFTRELPSSYVLVISIKEAKCESLIIQS